MKRPVEILIGPDSISLIYPPLEIDTGILMHSATHCERERYPFDGKLVQDKITAEKTVREMREGRWL